jgi:hypothetical protein
MTPTLSKDVDPNLWLLLPRGVDSSAWATGQAELARTEVIGGAPAQG